MSYNVSLVELYNTLLLGEAIGIEFNSGQEAETFRIRMHQYKAAQEEAIKSVGMDFEPTTFSFKLLNDNNTYKMQFISKKPRREYKIIELDN